MRARLASWIYFFVTVEGGNSGIKRISMTRVEADVTANWKRAFEQDGFFNRLELATLDKFKSELDLLIDESISIPNAIILDCVALTHTKQPDPFEWKEEKKRPAAAKQRKRA